MAKKLLLIDDDSILCTSLADELEDAGFEVVKAYNGQEGMDLALSEKPDIVLSDIMMPIKDGIQLVDELKKNKETKDIPVIIITVSAEQEKLDKVMSMGAQDALIKSQYTLRGIADKLKVYL